MPTSARQTGFSLIESTVVMAIVALLTLVVITGAGTNTKIERFNANVRSFANVLREAQTKSYSVQTGSGACTTAGGQTMATCYWRGNVLEYTKDAAAYNLQLLYGDDLNLYAATIGNSGVCATADQQLCLEGKQASGQPYALTDQGVALTAITVTGVGPVDNVSVAFLVPDGKMYTAQTIVAANQFNPSQRHYSGQNAVSFTLKDSAVPGLTGIVTVDPASGAINSQVQ